MAVVLALALASPASAHEVSRSQCRTYALMHAFTTGSKPRGTVAGRACRIVAGAHLLTHPLPASHVPDALLRIRGCESGSGPYSRPNYRAQNPSSTASGAYQYLSSTWGGHRGYARAADAPPRVQDLRAIRDYNAVGTTPWAASRGCWG